MYPTRSISALPILLALILSSAIVSRPFSLFGQTQQSTAAAITNADILSLTAAGLAPDIIISRIRTAPAKSFDTSVDALKALKAAGVSNDVIVVMVNGGAVPPANPTAATGELKEPLLKEGLWEESTTMVQQPGAPASGPDVRYTCHTHAKDHADFQKLTHGASSEHARKRLEYERKGLRSLSPDDDLEDKCKVTKAVVEDGKQVLEQACQAHGMSVTSMMAWTRPDEEHLHSDATVSYSPPVAGMSNATMATELTFKGPCPAGLAPGESLDEPPAGLPKKAGK